MTLHQKPRHLLIVIAILALSGCAHDMIMDLGEGDSIRFVGQADSFDCDDPKYAHVEKVETTKIFFPDRTSMRLCMTKEDFAVMVKRPRTPEALAKSEITLMPSKDKVIAPVSPTLAENPNAPIVHAIGIFEAVNGEATVQINEKRRHLILALSAYKKTNWRLALSSGVQLEKVILSGHEAQSISGLPSGIPVHVYTYEHSPCSQCSVGSGHFHAHVQPHPRINEITLQSINSFQNASMFNSSVGTKFLIPPLQLR